MPTAMTHAVVGVVGASLVAARGGRAPGEPGAPALPRRFWVLAAGLPMLPDLDVVGFALGVRYGDLLGHRGLSHSLLFAVVAGAFAATAIAGAPRRGASGAGEAAEGGGPAPGGPALSWRSLALLFAALVASHGLLDAFTDGGMGVAFLSPFSNRRFFFPVTPIPVSPIGIRSFLGPYGLQVLGAEAALIWLPLVALAAAARRRARA